MIESIVSGRERVENAINRAEAEMQQLAQ